MGGNLFDNNRRMDSKEDFNDVLTKQTLLFKEITNLISPRLLGDKQSFGDIDLVYDNQYTQAIKDVLKQIGYPTHQNGTIISYQTPDLVQIDLISIPQDKIDFAVNYFSFGDHGNILGRLLKQLYLKHTFLGLKYEFKRDNGSYQRDFLLTDNYDDVLELLGLDKQQFHVGFDTQFDIFEWIYQSPFMDSKRFEFDNLNHKNRMRDRKRKFYNSWLDFLADKPKAPSETFLQKERDNLTHKFPMLSDNLANVEYEYNKTKAIKQKFNGEIVSSITGLKGVELGKFMKAFKAIHTNDELYSLAADDIKALINSFSTTR